ncbi:MAG: hypothetical protein JWO82_390 [Akkermansiaceae bacterium]|nr:hypothetical protein [Akkermansiaceae bacterium]
MQPLTYVSSRLSFRQDVIERLGPEDKFRVKTPMGVFEMSRKSFEKNFANVVSSHSYKEDGIYHYPKVPARAMEYRLSDVAALALNGPAEPVVYELPEILDGKVDVETYRTWLKFKGATQIRLDMERWQLAQSQAAYEKAIDEAVRAHNGTDPFTGEELRWDLLKKANNDNYKAGRFSYTRIFRLLPTVDLLNVEPTEEPSFRIVAWEVSAAKNDLGSAGFVELCRRVVAKADSSGVPSDLTLG